MTDPKKQKKLDKQYTKKVKAKTKQSSKERGITGKEARLAARRAKLSSKAMSGNYSLEKADRLLAKDEKLGKKLRSERAKEKSNNSPVKFMGGLAATAARSSSGGGTGSLGNISKGMFGKVNRAIAEKEQADYRAGANVGDPFFKPGVERIRPEQRTDSAAYKNKSVFTPQQNMYGDVIFGNQEQRTRSMPNRGNVEGPLLMEDLSGDGKITQKDIGIGQG